MLSKVIYPQWFIDELVHEEDKERARNRQLLTTEKVDFICEIHGKYNQKVGDHISKGKRKCGCPECGKNGYNLVGKYFGYLEVLCKNGHDRFGKVLWHCKCTNCGRELDVTTQGLTDSSDTRTCGKCKKLQTEAKVPKLITDKCTTQVKDISGERFGSLVAKEVAYIKDGRAFWRCDCLKCGNKDKVVNGKDLRAGKIKTCGCSDIAHNGSQIERDICDFICKELNTNRDVIHDRSILGGKEIDIYLPEFRLGIEYNGSVFHATENNMYKDKSKLYHRDKFLLAKSKGVHLINIFDVDWENNQDKIKMYLKSLLIQNKKLCARKCNLRVVDNDIAIGFVNEYHLQGANKATMKINYGLYLGNELMAVMSFGRFRLAKCKEGEYELHRYCVKDGYTILGGAERLLKAFERDYSPKYIVSYSDNDYFLGGIYERLKFENKGQCRPRYYWYLNGNELRRERCQLKHLKVKYPELLQEAIEVGAKNKEDYVMVKLGACKVYRSGNTKWERKY